MNPPGANTYTGATTTGGGATLKLGVNNALPTGTAVTNAGTLDLNGFNQTVASIANTGNINMANGVTNQTLTTAVLSGNGTVNLDINLSQASPGQLADKIVVTNPAGFAAGTALVQALGA
mgnify:CR=1 FL=1